MLTTYQNNDIFSATKNKSKQTINLNFAANKNIWLSLAQVVYITLMDTIRQ